MFCPVHPKTKMTQLFTSWVCDMCQPPAGQSVPKIASINGVAQLPVSDLVSYPIPPFPPLPLGKNPTHTCSYSYRWNLWPRDYAELHTRVDPDVDMYYLSSKQVNSVDERILDRICSVIISIRFDPMKAFFNIEYQKHRYNHYTAPLSGLSANVQKDLFYTLDRVALPMDNSSFERIVYFLDV